MTTNYVYNIVSTDFNLFEESVEVNFEITTANSSDWTQFTNQSVSGNKITFTFYGLYDLFTKNLVKNYVVSGSSSNTATSLSLNNILMKIVYLIKNSQSLALLDNNTNTYQSTHVSAFENFVTNTLNTLNNTTLKDGTFTGSKISEALNVNDTLTLPILINLKIDSLLSKTILFNLNITKTS